MPSLETSVSVSFCLASQPSSTVFTVLGPSPATTDPAGAGAAGASSAMAVTLRQEATTHAATTPDKNFFIFITCSPLSFLKRSGSSGKFFIFYSTTSFRKKQEQSALSCHFLPPFLPPQTDNFRPPVRRPPAYASPARRTPGPPRAPPRRRPRPNLCARLDKFFRAVYNPT